MKKTTLVVIIVTLSTFVCAGVSFNKAMVYGELDKTVTVSDAMGVDFDLNDSMSIGYDTALGLMVKADGPVGILIRLGWHDTAGTSTLGVGYNWWTGGEIIKTSIGTFLDYSSTGAGTDNTSVRLNLGWGF